MSRNESRRRLDRREFMRVATEDIEMGNGQKQRRDLIQPDGKAPMGWFGLAVVMEPVEEGNQEIQSAGVLQHCPHLVSRASSAA